MKKITLLLSFIVCVVFAQAQTNLLTNPGFETWTDGSKPDGWIFDKTTATLSKESTIAKTGSSLKIAATGTYWVTQNIAVTPGKTYTLRLSYYIGGGDGTDFRIWSNFYKLNETTQVWNTMTTTDSLALKGPGGNTTTAYFPNETGEWKTYTYDVIAPAGFTNFSYQVRAYTSSTVYLDDLFFGERITGTSNPTEDALQAFVSGKNLMIQNAVEGSKVEIYSALGSKLQTSTLEDGKVSLDNLSKGLYVVRIGKKAQKFML